jgi:hypothetical protein
MKSGFQTCLGLLKQALRSEEMRLVSQLAPELFDLVLALWCAAIYHALVHDGILARHGASQGRPMNSTQTQYCQLVSRRTEVSTMVGKEGSDNTVRNAPEQYETAKIIIGPRENKN